MRYKITADNIYFHPVLRSVRCNVVACTFETSREVWESRDLDALIGDVVEFNEWDAHQVGGITLCKHMLIPLEEEKKKKYKVVKRIDNPATTCPRCELLWVPQLDQLIGKEFEHEGKVNLGWSKNSKCIRYNSGIPNGIGGEYKICNNWLEPVEESSMDWWLSGDFFKQSYADGTNQHTGIDWSYDSVSCSWLGTGSTHYWTNVTAPCAIVDDVDRSSHDDSPEPPQHDVTSTIRSLRRR